MVTQGQKIAYLKKSNSDRQKFAPKLTMKFMQLTHVSRIKDWFMQQCYTKFDCIFTYKWIYCLSNGIIFVLPW